MSLPEPLRSPGRGRPTLERSRRVAVRSGDGRPEVSWCADGGVGRVGRVAGDAGRGQSLIVWAIAEGRAAAAAVDRHLMGETQLPEPVRPTDAPLR